MTLKDMIIKNDFESVWTNIENYYYSVDNILQKPVEENEKRAAKEKYRLVYKELTELPINEVPSELDDIPDTIVVIRLYGTSANDYDFIWSVLSLSRKTEELYGIELEEWNNLLGMNVAQECINEYSEEIVLAHILYEMTFLGMNKNEVDNRRKEIFISLEETKNEECEYISFEELYEEIGYTDNRTVDEIKAEMEKDYSINIKNDEIKNDMLKRILSENF